MFITVISPFLFLKKLLPHGHVPIFLEKINKKIKQILKKIYKKNLIKYANFITKLRKKSEMGDMTAF